MRVDAALSGESANLRDGPGISQFVLLNSHGHEKHSSRCRFVVTIFDPLHSYTRSFVNRNARLRKVNFFKRGGPALKLMLCEERHTKDCVLSISSAPSPKQTHPQVS